MAEEFRVYDEENMNDAGGQHRLCPMQTLYQDYTSARIDLIEPIQHVLYNAIAYYTQFRRLSSSSSSLQSSASPSAAMASPPPPAAAAASASAVASAMAAMQQPSVAASVAAAAAAAASASSTAPFHSHHHHHHHPHLNSHHHHPHLNYNFHAHLHPNDHLISSAAAAASLKSLNLKHRPLNTAAAGNQQTTVGGGSAAAAAALMQPAMNAGQQQHRQLNNAHPNHQHTRDAHNAAAVVNQRAAADLATAAAGDTDADIDVDAEGEFESAATSSSLSSPASQQQRQQHQEHIKKPLNPFMLFMKKLRPEIVKQGEMKESASINRELGKLWRQLSKEQQAPYYKLAEQEKIIHAQKYPHWTARDNYAIQKKRKKQKLKTIAPDQSDKKCRARFGVDNMASWCKPCKRKKKCKYVYTPLVVN